MAALHLVRAEQPPQRPDGDLIDQWADYMTACGATLATVRIRTQTLTALKRHAGIDDPLDLTRGHVIAYLGRPVKQWSRVTYLVSDTQLFGMAARVPPRPR
jgi:hypothetical protein